MSHRPMTTDTGETQSGKDTADSIMEKITNITEDNTPLVILGVILIGFMYFKKN